MLFRKKPDTVTDQLLSIAVSLDALAQLLESQSETGWTLDRSGIDGVAAILESLKKQTMKTLGMVDPDYE